MSSILDALRKAEGETQEVVRSSAVESRRARRRAGTPSHEVIRLVLLMILAGSALVCTAVLIRERVGVFEQLQPVIPPTPLRKGGSNMQVPP